MSAGAIALQPGEGLVVAAPLKVMREIRIDGWRQPALQIDNRDRNFLQTRQLTGGVAVTPRGVANHGDTIPQGRSELIVDRSWIHSCTIACSGDRLQSSPACPAFASKSVA
jgi:hypothetical protein